MVVDQLFDLRQHITVTLLCTLLGEVFYNEAAALWDNLAEEDALINRLECLPVEIEDLELPEAVIQGGAVGDELVDPLNVAIVDLFLKTIGFRFRKWVHQRF